MNYLKFGNSKNFIVFLHGWGADLNSFLWLKDFYDDYSLIFVDFAGFGKSNEPSVPFSVSDYAKELKCLLSQFEIDKLVLVGHSFGGRVAIKFGFLYQNEYNEFRLCLVDSAGIKPRRNLMYYIRVARFKHAKKRALKNKRIAAKLSGFGSADYKGLSPVLKQTFVKVVSEDLSTDAKFLKCQTLIIWGENDKETKLFMAKKLHKLIVGSKLYVLKGAGHFSFLDEKHEFLIILDTFIRNKYNVI
jgi:pimeloyl-ACP methyl ester carboxylesterase